MLHRSTYAALPGLQLDRTLAHPLHRQLYDALRLLILRGQLSAGERLPPTRTLCAELDISRSTVVTAITQLTHEGYLEGTPGRGTFIAQALPDSMLTTATPVNPALANTRLPRQIALSPRGQMLIQDQSPVHAEVRIFQPGLPETDQFPMTVWQRIITRILKDHRQADLQYNSAAGYLPLREAITDHVRLTRGVICTPEQVIITTGMQQAVFLTAQLLMQPNDKVLIENPGYMGARAALWGAGAQLIPVPVDQDGMDVSAGIALEPAAKLAYISPSHQYPVGGTLTLARRMQLLEWADQANSMLIEDDYDSEFRYKGHPLASLQSLDQNQRVVYIGTFSKTLFPGLRLGYAIVPPALSHAFAVARNNIDRGSEWLSQLALNAFIREGHFVRHIRRMRTLYAQRQQVLIEALQTDCAPWISVEPAPAGLHLLGRFKVDLDAEAVFNALLDVGISAPPLSRYSITPLARDGLVFGYAAVDEGTIRASVKKIRKVLEQLTS